MSQHDVPGGRGSMEDGSFSLSTEITCSAVQDETMVVAVAGEFDLLSRGRLVAAVAQALDRHRASRVIVDFGGLEFMDSTGLHEIGLLLDVAAERGGTKVTVVGARPLIRHVFAAGGLDDVLAD